jgi:hypothetical protein
MQLPLSRNLARVVSAGVAALIATVAWAQCEYTTLVQQVIASDPQEREYFGSAVALDGATIAIGAPFSIAAMGTSDIGAVYVFTRAGDFVTLQQKLTASDGAERNGFGASISLMGNTLLVGAPGDDGGRGAAYVFTRSGTTWTQQAKLVASGLINPDFFGSAVSLTSSGQRNVAVIGAPRDDNQGPNGVTGGADAGAAYVFTLNTLLVGAQWTEVEKIMATDGSPFDEFGESISARGATVIIGARLADTIAGNDSGSAYVFTGNVTASTWTQQVRLVPDNGASNARFGSDVSYESNTAFIGAPGQMSGSGAFYVFTRSGTVWTQAQYIPGTASSFGATLKLSGELALVGSSFSQDVRPPVKLYRRVDGVWTFLREISREGETPGFGAPVAINGTTVAISSPYFSQAESNQGSVYIYDLDSGPSTQVSSPPSDTSVCPGEAASFDVQADGVQLAYRWQYGDSLGSVWTLTDGQSALGTVSGATTPNLTFTTGQTREVRCRITSACGVVNTDWVTLTVREANDPVCTDEPVCPECAADYDQDGGVTGSDIGAFFIDFESGAACADVDLDGGITGADLGYFFQVFESGGC